MAISTGVNDLLLQDIYMIYENAEQVMLRKVANRVKRGVTTTGWNEQKLSDIQGLRREIEKEIALVHSKVIPGSAQSIISAYLKGINSVNNELKLPKTSLDKIQVPYHVQRLVMDANQILQGSSFRILRESTDIYRSAVADSNAMVLTGVETRLDATQRVLNNFAAAGITGFVDKAGRRWEMATYAEMAVRTGTAKAALQGHVDRSTELGLDLMIVSHFGRTCPICAPWEGKVLSISGKDPKYPSLDSAKAAGLFHPNCKHTLLAYFPGITDVPRGLDNNHQAYQDMQRQRYNERMIRKYKRISSVAMTPLAQQQAESKVKKWQQIQRDHISTTGLTRRYAREGIRSRTGIAGNAIVGPQLLKMDDVSWSEYQRKMLQKVGVNPIQPPAPPTPNPKPPGNHPPLEKYTNHELMAILEGLTYRHLKQLGNSDSYASIEAKNRAKGIIPQGKAGFVKQIEETKKQLDKLGIAYDDLFPIKDPKSPVVATPKSKEPKKPKEKKLTFGNGKQTNFRRVMDSKDPGLLSRVIKDADTRMMPNAKAVLIKKQTWMNFESSDFEDQGFYRGGSSRLVRVDKILNDESNTRGTGKFSVLWHEIGHAMDDAYGRPSTNDKLYTEAIKKDWNRLEQLGQHQLQQKVRVINNDDISNGVQDIVSGLSGRTITVRWGHSMDYWKRKGDWPPYTEAKNELFAHMFQATTDPKAKAYIKEFFPDTWGWFENWLARNAK